MRHSFRLLLLCSALLAAATQTKYKVIGGAVLDSAGIPVASADVEMQLSDVSGQPLRSRHTPTDLLGHYAFSTVETSGVGLHVTATGKTWRSQTFTTRSDREGVLVIDIVVQN